MIVKHLILENFNTYMEYKNISLEELKEYTQNHNAIILENCDINGCESIEQMEMILNSVHFFDDTTERKSIAGDSQILDVHRITGTSKWMDRRIDQIYYKSSYDIRKLCIWY